MDQRDNILSQLNENQQLAVTYCDGPQLVIAGAGSGKTRVLTYKIAWLLKNVGLNPWNILALTFTNKAANEMKERIGGLVGNERARYLQMGTFHSVFARILRAESNYVGFTSNFTIYDEADSRSLIKNIVRQMTKFISRQQYTRLSLCRKTVCGQPDNMPKTASYWNATAEEICLKHIRFSSYMSSGCSRPTLWTLTIYWFKPTVC